MEKPNPNKPENTSNEIRKMGIILLILGLLLCAAGVMAYQYDVPAKENIRNILMAILGMALSISGIYTWRSGKDAG